MDDAVGAMNGPGSVSLERARGLSAGKLRALADRLKEKKRAETPETSGIPRLAERAGPIALSYAQERLWFLDQLEPGKPFYNIPGAVRIAGPLAVPVLAACLSELSRRHESLRTVFGSEAGRPFQRILPGEPVPLPEVDLSSLPAGARERELSLLGTAETQRPFDLAAGPLWRVVLFTAGKADRVVVYTFHHIISDGWSSNVFYRELGALYDAFAAGRPSLLPPLPVQYPDYAAWQRRVLSGETLERQLGFWRERLEGTPALELPTDRPRPAVETFRGTSFPLLLSSEATAALTELARSRGGSLFMALLTAYAALLSRHSGQRDLAIGSPIANRNRREVEGVIGFFANTLVLRLDLAGRPTFGELFAQVREVTLAAYAHEDLPFEKVVEELKPERDMSRNPLFQVMLVLQNQPTGSLPSGDLVLHPFQVHLGAAKFDLTVFWQEGDGRLGGALEYNTDLFDEPTARRLALGYEALLEALAANPGEAVFDSPLLSAAQRHQILCEWNDTGKSTALAEGAVARQVERQAARTPQKIAATFAGEDLSYRDLELRTNRFARALAARGVGLESRVGVCLSRSLSMVVATLAVLKAGGALVALDPAYPDERLAAILEDAGLSLLLVSPDMAERFAGFPRRLVVGRDEEDFAGFPAERLPVSPDPEHAMYVIYTSGTTGKPKGIVVPHRAFANFLSWQLTSSPWAPGSTTVQMATYGFCVSFQEIFTAWCSGGTLVVASEMTRRDLAQLGPFLAESGVERLHLPYAALKNLADAALSSGAAFPPLSEVVTAGEQLRVTPALRALFSRLPGCVLTNQYGASETHVVSSLSLAGEPGGWPDLPAVGTPIARVRIHLLDGRGAPVPVGVRGELHAGGSAVPRCYLNDPALTAAKIVPDPFAALHGEPGARLYRTGDAARHLPGGAIEHLGRIDGQVKVRGFRVEPGEVETVLARHPSVADAAVIALPDPAAGYRLVAYLVMADGGGAVPAAELRAFLHQRLPDYMVPAAFVGLAELPLSANGKLDTAALPAPVAPAAEAAADGGRLTPTEEILAALWEALLGRRPTRDDSFFALGGHSLLATQVVSRVRETFGIELPLRALFESPTLAALAEEIDRRRRESEGLAVPPLVAGPDLAGEPAPLSFAQQRLWFLDRFEPGSSAYNMPLPVRLTGALSVPALAAGLSGIVARHGALRTSFVEVSGQPMQIVAPPADLPLPLADLTALPADARDREARRVLGEEAERPFDLARGPVVRALLLRLAPEEHAALLAMHHIASDGWSLGVAVEELGELYAAHSTGRPSSLPPLPVQYTDFARWQRSWLAGETLEREVEFWRRHLAGTAPLLELPTDRPRAAVRSEAGAARPLWLPAGMVGPVRRAAQEAGATVFMVLLAGLAALLARLTGQDRFALGSPIAGRNRLETERLIGFFVNTLVLPADLAGDPGMGELAALVRGATLSAYAHQDVPFERLVEALAPERSLAWSPLFQVMFALQNAPMAPLDLPGVTLAPFALARKTSQFDLSLSLWEGDDGFTGEIEYNRDLFDAVTIDRLAGQLEVLLAAALAEPLRPFSRLPLLSPAQAQQALVEWNDPGEVAEEGEGVERIAGWAARSPETAALRLDDGAELSYGDFWEAARRLAGRLAAMGVGPEVPVAVCLPREPSGIVALVAVLAAGGAYLPLDPALPPQRLGYQLTDSGARVLVTRGSLLAAAGVSAGDLGVALLDLDTLHGLADGESLSEPALLPETAAYVLYTSGSTGRPKGVVVSHGALAAHLAAVRPFFGIAPGMGVLQFAAWSFDASLEQILATLTAGGTVVLRGEELWPYGELLPRLAALEVAVADLPTAYWQGWVAACGEDPAPPGLSLRVVAPGGEAMPWAPAVRFPATAAGGARLTNGYGPTEAVITASFYEVPESLPFTPATVPVGRPLPGRSMHVVDRTLEPRPLGAPGELLLGGPLARGYLNRPDLTAERFVPDSWGAPGSRLYRSGDLARLLPDGTVEVLGRIDRQVKLRGLRIELEEIEAALLAHPAVVEAAVVLAGDHLAAYVAPAEAVVQELKADLLGLLPEYMVPTLWAGLEELPKGVTGKVDRRALPDPQAPAAAAYEPPATPVEEALAEIWREVLDLPRVGRQDDFFHLGGHSLLAVQLVSRLRDLLEVELPVRAVFEAPRLADLAEAVTAELSRLAGDDLMDEILAQEA